MSTTFEAPPLAGRGFKGLFSRSRLSTPDPTAERTIKSRLRSFINDPHIRPTSRRTSRTETPAPLSHQPPMPCKSRASGRESPGRRRPDKVAVSALPIIQRGVDGRWQPPSLSKGSMSTSALAIYADESAATKAEPSTRKARVALSAYFDQGEGPSRPSTASRDATPKAGPSRKALLVSPLNLDPLEKPRDRPRLRESSTETIIPVRKAFPASTSTSSIDPILSYDHYVLRLAVSFLIRSLPLVLRASGFVKNAKTSEMKAVAEERLATLGRMEKAWGTEWGQAAKLVQTGETNSNHAGGRTALSILEDKVRRVSVGKRTKEREGRQFADALADGILLCLLLNHLFPSQPPHITRVNMSEDALVRATNLTRFTLACHAVGLPSAEVFGISDLQEASESSLSKVAKTFIALARLAGKSNARVGRPRSAALPSPALSGESSSIAASRTAFPGSGQPEHVADRAPIDGRRPTSAPAGAISNANDLQSRLQTMTSVQSAETEMEDSPKTPVAPVFAAPLVANLTESPPGVGRPAMPRSQTQPIQSSVRPKSPTPSTGSRCPTPTGRITPTAGRPILRPRYSSGARPQVSAVNGLPTLATAQSRGGTNPPRVGVHAQERTPSLISSRSRVTSGYSRSSGVQSIVSFPSGDYSHAVPWSFEEGESGTRMESTGYFDQSHGGLWHGSAGGLAFVDSKGVPRDARGFALSQSLAALEGQLAMPVDTPPTPPSRPHPSSRLSRVDVSRVLEEDESAISPVSPTPRPPIRRVSTSGKTYVPKRSTSPQSAGQSDPTYASSQDDRSRMPPPPVPPHHQGTRPPTLMARRQSDTAAVKHNAARSGPHGDVPMNMKTSSMVNHPGTPMTFERSNSSFSAGGSSQYIEVYPPGRSPVRYQLGNCIGRGQVGSVYRSLNATTGQMAAVKRINLSGLQPSEVDGVMHEVELLKSLDHPSIVKYEGMSKDDEYLNIILEYVENGSLGQTLKAFGNFNENLLSSYVIKILEGLIYLHSQGVVHCDLKAANILSTKNGNIKLSDFGVSLVTRAVVNIKRDSLSGRTKKRPSSRPGTDIAGTPNWMAPEVISLNGASPPSDIWSLGCTIIELLTGKPPYANISNSMTVLFRIVEDEMPPLPENISDVLRDFLHLCFIKDPTARPSAVALSLHPWVCKAESTSNRPLDSIPFLRRVSMNSQRPSSSVFPAYGEDLPRPSSMALTASRPASMVLSDMSVDDTPGYGQHQIHAIATPTRPNYGPIPLPPTPRKSHKLVKTTFSKAILCRVCHSHVKKSGVLCQSCGMICHTSCADNAIANCDITQQLALLARQEELLQVATMSSTASFHTAQSSAGGRRSVSVVRASGDDSLERQENPPLRERLLSGLGGLRSRKGSSAGQTRSRLSSRRSSKALPLAPSLENEATGFPGPGEHRRLSAIRFEVANDAGHDKGKHVNGEPSNNVEVDVLATKESVLGDKSDCLLM